MHFHRSWLPIIIYNITTISIKQTISSTSQIKFTCNCGNTCTLKWALTVRWISKRCSPKLFDTLQVHRPASSAFNRRICRMSWDGSSLGVECTGCKWPPISRNQLKYSFDYDISMTYQLEIGESNFQSVITWNLGVGFLVPNMSSEYRFRGRTTGLFVRLELDAVTYFESALKLIKLCSL